MLPLLFILFPVLFGQPASGSAAWSVAVDPSVAGASGTHWTFVLSARYCGGYDIGDGVFIQPEAPLSLPDPVPSDGVLFGGLAADVSIQNGVLQVRPSPDRLWSQVCIQGNRPFTIELLPSLGLINPDSGNYAVDAWIGSGSTSIQLPISIDDSGASSLEPIWAMTHTRP